MDWKTKGALISAAAVIAAGMAGQVTTGLPQHLFIVQAKIRAAVWLTLHVIPLIGILFSIAGRGARVSRALLLFHAITAAQVWGELWW